MSQQVKDQFEKIFNVIGKIREESYYQGWLDIADAIDKEVIQLKKMIEKN